MSNKVANLYTACRPASTLPVLAVAVSVMAEAEAKMALISDAPVSNPKFLDKLSTPEMLPRARGKLLIIVRVLLADKNIA